MKKIILIVLVIIIWGLGTEYAKAQEITETPTITLVPSRTPIYSIKETEDYNYDCIVGTPNGWGTVTPGYLWQLNCEKCKYEIETETPTKTSTVNCIKSTNTPSYIESETPLPYCESTETPTITPTKTPTSIQKIYKEDGIGSFGLSSNGIGGCDVSRRGLGQFSIPQNSDPLRGYGYSASLDPTGNGHGFINTSGNSVAYQGMSKIGTNGVLCWDTGQGECNQLGMTRQGISAALNPSYNYSLPGKLGVFLWANCSYRTSGSFSNSFTIRYGRNWSRLTPTPTKTPIIGTGESYCSEVHEDETSQAWTGIIYTYALCFDTPEIEFSVLGFDVYIPVINICLQGISVGELLILGVKVDLDALLLIFGGITILYLIFMT